MKALVALPIVVAGVIACAGVGERTDTSKVLPVNDIHAIDTTPPPPPAKVTKLSILDSLPLGGVCNVKRYRAKADQAREIFYETLAPQRTYVIEIGKGLRVFPAVSLDMRGTQIGDGLEETENVYVGFTEQGKVSVGVRRYTAVGGSTQINDRMPLDFGDSAKILAFATKILEMCDPGR